MQRRISKLDYKIITKEEVPPEELVVSERSILYDLFKSLPFDKAVCIKCISAGDRLDKNTMVSGISTKLRKEERFKLVTRTIYEPLSDKRQAAYDRSVHKGTFRRVCSLYVWKEQLD